LLQCTGKIYILIILLFFPLVFPPGLAAQDAKTDSSVKSPEESFVITEEGTPTTTTTPQRTQQEQFTGVTIWDFVRMILILAGVVGAIYALFYFLKKSATPRNLESDLVRVLDYKMLIGNKAVHLVELGTHIYLLSSAESSVSLISEITDKETLDKIRLEVSQRPNLVQPKFAQVLSKLLGNKETPSLTVNDTFSFMKKQKDRLKKLQ
jgi:flagellar protein FliO/FliZ